ncbi:hypothetical protein D9M71_486000 [compost metagenome]
MALDVAAQVDQPQHRQRHARAAEQAQVQRQRRYLRKQQRHAEVRIDAEIAAIGVQLAQIEAHHVAVQRQVGHALALPEAATRQEHAAVTAEQRGQLALQGGTPEMRSAAQDGQSASGWQAPGGSLVRHARWYRAAWLVAGMASPCGRAMANGWCRAHEAERFIRRWDRADWRRITLARYSPYPDAASSCRGHARDPSSGNHGRHVHLAAGTFPGDPGAFLRHRLAPFPASADHSPAGRLAAALSVTDESIRCTPSSPASCAPPHCPPTPCSARNCCIGWPTPASAAA